MRVVDMMDRYNIGYGSVNHNRNRCLECGHENSTPNLEKEMLETINNLGIGPGGLGGRTTALAVNIETYPTHIAGLPVGINICCHVNRHTHRVI